MEMRKVRIEAAEGIPPEWGEPRLAIRKGSVSVREPIGVETFVQPWGVLTAHPGEDYVVVEDSGEAYPIKRDVFSSTYQALGEGRYRKSACSRLVQVPEGWVAVLATLEGELEVRHPDYVAIGQTGEVYANSRDWVAANLAFAD